MFVKPVADPSVRRGKLQRFSQALESFSDATEANSQSVEQSYQNPKLWALADFPKPPNGSPEEQQLWNRIQAATTPSEKAAAHQGLAEYWQAKAQPDKTAREFSRVQSPAAK